MTPPLYFDSHMHTPLCKHAEGKPVEYARVGQNRGLKGVIFTCHSPMPDGFSHRVRMEPGQFDGYVAMVAEATEKMAEKGFVVRLGLESDFFPGMESWLEELHQRAEFHYILGSVHPFTSEYVDAYRTEGEDIAFQAQYFTHLAEAAETGLFDCLSHPDVVKSMFPRDWKFEAVRTVVEAALDRIAKTGVAMELNTSGMWKALPEMNPGPEMLSLIAARGIPVVLGSDSHVPRRVAENFPLALDLLEQAGFRQVSCFEDRRRQDFPIGAVRESLRGDPGTADLPLVSS